MIESFDIGVFTSTYLIPWGINISLAIMVFVVGKMVANILVGVAVKLMTRAKMDGMLVNFIQSIMKVTLLLFVLIASLERLGVATTSLIALLGAAGLAVGLALQGSLQNFAAGVMLIIFRPFKTGDYIDAAGVMGTVEKINIFNSVLLTTDNRQIIVPNSAIFSGTITNFSAQPNRRVDLVFSIGYGDDLRQAKSLIQNLLESDARVLQDPAPTVVIGELGDSSVNILVWPWVKRGDYWGVKCDLLEKVKLAFDEKGISIPFPQMDVHLEKVA